eukprot:scaffold40369_cov51-Phaeocystis_antarctica.AAC.5
MVRCREAGGASFGRRTRELGAGPVNLAGGLEKTHGRVMTAEAESTPLVGSSRKSTSIKGKLIRGDGLGRLGPVRVRG